MTCFGISGSHFFCPRFNVLLQPSEWRGQTKNRQFRFRLQDLFSTYFAQLLQRKTPQEFKTFLLYSVDLTQGANFTVSAVGKAKGLLPNQICRLCYDCVTVFANKTCIFAKSKSADCCYIPLGASAAKFGQNNESAWRLASAKYI